MKSIATVLLLVLAFNTNLFAQFLDEDFEYPDGALISNYNWVPFSGIGVNPIHVTSPGLEFDCYSCGGFGNSVLLNSTGEDVYKLMHRNISTGSVYLAFMIKVTAAQTGDFFLHLGDSVVNNSNKIARVYIKSSTGGMSIGLAKDNETPVYAGGYLLNKTYLLLLKYTFVAGSNNDQVRLFVFEDCPPMLEPSPTLGPVSNGDDLPNVGKVILQQGANSKAPTMYVDGLCLRDSWDDGALPVELISFNADVRKRDVTLNWSTATETNNAGFEIERSVNMGEWSKIGFVNGNGTVTNQQNYVYNDKNLESGKYNYRLKQVDFNGNFTYFNLTNQISIGSPSSYNMSMNYPNPFNPSTKIDFELPADGNVSIKVYDNLGRTVATLVNEYKTAGFYTLNFNAANLSSGLYFYKMEVNGFVKMLKMTLVK